MKLSFIGSGNMATAMLKGILAKGIVDKKDIIISEINAEKLKEKCDELGVNGTIDNRMAAQAGDVVFLAVKPQFYQDVIAEIKDSIDEKQIIVAIAPGKTLKWISEQIGKPVKVVRTMPNTPALVQEGMTGVCANERVSMDELESIIKLLEGFGKVEIVPEDLMDAVIAASGSSPAYVFMLIDAMVKTAVAEGMTESQAKTFVAQAVLGSAKMVMETDKSPSELKEMVCSPGGTTIEAVRVFEQKKMQDIVAEAMKACINRSKEL